MTNVDTQTLIELLTDIVEEYNLVLKYAHTDNEFREKLERVIGYSLATEGEMLEEA